MSVHSIEIAGTNYEIRYTINAVRKLEKELGTSAFAIVQEGISIDALQTLFWAGLLHQNPALTVDQAGILLEQYLEEGGSLNGLTSVITPAYTKWIQKLVKASPPKAGASTKKAPA